MKLITAISALIFSISVYSSTANKAELSHSFYKDLLNTKSFSLPQEDQCHPRPDITPCISTVCNKLSPFGCDNEEKIMAAANMCHGNFGSECLQSTFKNISVFDADEMDELSEIAQSCSSVYGNLCPQFFTSHLSSFEYNDRSKMISINNQCKNISPEVIKCAQYICSKLPYDSCNSMDKLTDAINSCNGK